MPNLTEYGDFILNSIDEYGRRKIDGLLEDGVKVIIVAAGIILKQWSQTGYTTHVYSRPFRSFKLTQTLNPAHIFHRPFKTLKFAQTLNSLHVYLRHKTFKLTQTLKTLSQWTLPIPAFLKQWFAILQTTHVFRRPYRSLKLSQALNLAHVFRRPFRFLKLTQNLNLSHVLKANKLLKYLTQTLKTLANWIKRALGGFPFKISVEERQPINVQIEEYKPIHVTVEEHELIKIIVEERTE